MELGQGTRQNLNAQRCTLSSIGFSVFSLCLYVLGFYKNPTVNKYSYFYGSHCLLRRVFLPATPFYQATSHMVRWPARAVFHIWWQRWDGTLTEILGGSKARKRRPTLAGEGLPAAQLELQQELEQQVEPERGGRLVPPLGGETPEGEGNVKR